MLKKSADLKQKVREFLEFYCLGADKAKTAAQASFLLNIDSRVFRAIVHELRAVDNVPILSSSSQGGYFIPKDESEINIGLQEFAGRIVALRTAVKGIRTGLSVRFPNNSIQFPLFDTNDTGTN